MLISCGDLWLVPPVKEILVYAFPLYKANGEKYTAAEQAILAMFWKRKEPENQDGIQILFELTQANRSKDPWHLAVLAEDRDGAERWEVYCFHPWLWFPHVHIKIAHARMLAQAIIIFESGSDLAFQEKSKKTHNVSYVSNVLVSSTDSKQPADDESGVMVFIE